MADARDRPVRDACAHWPKPPPLTYLYLTSTARLRDSLVVPVTRRPPPPQRGAMSDGGSDIVDTDELTNLKVPTADARCSL